MEQLLAHLIGDYILQTDKMAQLKTKNWAYALYHASWYSIPFLWLTHPTALAMAVILVTHAVIDRYRLARYVVQLKNSLGDWEHRWTFRNWSGYPGTMPEWMAFWLLIITDNTIHLSINYLSLRFL